MSNKLKAWMLITTDKDLNVEIATVEASSSQNALDWVSDVEFEEADNESSMFDYVELYPDDVQVIKLSMVNWWGVSDE